MKIIEINSTKNGSTGNIMLNIAKTARAAGVEAYTFSEKRKESFLPEGHEYFGSRAENMVHRIYSVTTGISGTGSIYGTYSLLKKIDQIKPDIIHLHNLHGWYINIPMLFDYIRKSKVKTVWTLHDCWAFTAQCSHFTIEKCEKWKTGCYSCPRYRLYPYSFVDKTDKMWKLKKKWLTGINDLTIVTPSKWLKNFVGQSFLCEYDTRVINNGINLEIFKPLKSDFRDKHCLNNKKIILGAASNWNNRKGLDVFAELSARLNVNYQIVLVGTDDKVAGSLPKSIIPVSRTANQTELAEIYSAADVFFNPTREENFPTVNIEALACGTPVVTFKTGGSPEVIDDKTGFAVECNDIDNAEKLIRKICMERIFSGENCIEHAKMFDMNKKFCEYCDLYNEIML